MSYPWDTGDLERNWLGYFIPGTRVLRNRVGAKPFNELQNAENDLVETRLIELRENPGQAFSAIVHTIFASFERSTVSSFRMSTTGPETSGPSGLKRATSPSAHRPISLSPWIT